MRPEQILSVVFDMIAALVMAAVFISARSEDFFSACICWFGLVCIGVYCHSASDLLIYSNDRRAKTNKNILTTAIILARVSFSTVLIWNVRIVLHAV